MTEPASDELIADLEDILTGHDGAQVWDDVAALISRIRKEQEDKAVMARALEPFALVSEHDIGESETDEDFFAPMKANNRAPRLTVGNLRRARAALTGSSTIISDMEAEIERLRSRYARVKVKFAALCHAVDGLEWEGVLGGHGTMMSAMWSLNAEFDELK